MAPNNKFDVRSVHESTKIKPILTPLSGEELHSRT